MDNVDFFLSFGMCLEEAEERAENVGSDFGIEEQIAFEERYLNFMMQCSQEADYESN